MSKSVYFHDYLKIGDKIWFSCININGLFSYDVKLEKFRLEAIFDKNDRKDIFMHMKLFEYKNKITFVPFQTRYIYVYDANTSIMREYPIALDDLETLYSYYMTGVQCGGKVYLLPCRSNQILEVNIETGEQKKIADIPEDWGDSKLPYAHKAIDMYENKLVVAPFQKDFFETIDIISGVRKRISINENYNGITHLQIYGDNLLLVGRNGKIGVHKWTGECIQSAKLQSMKESHKFYDITLKESKLYLTETDASKVALYNIKTNSISEITIPVGRDKQFAAFWGTTLFLKQVSTDFIRLMSAYDGKLYLINTDNNKIEEEKLICLEDTDYGECFLNQTQGYITEEYLDKVGIDTRKYIIKEMLQ